jgi:hypothetical protein
MNDHPETLRELREQGRLHWSATERAWSVEPDDIVSALTHDGFQEYKREEARARRDETPRGGVWQGLNSRTGSVASAIWVRRDEEPPSLVFINIDGTLLTDDRS